MTLGSEKSYNDGTLPLVSQLDDWLNKNMQEDQKPYGLELLAPAKDLQTGTAAINCGADAVYVGAGQFGAREAAGNPLEDIEKLARYAHRYWARVYVTVNILLHDDELPQAEKLIHQLYDLGADAIIIQDVGLLECSLPPIPLFASTQMHNHTPERVAFLEKVGIQRVILARELTLPQIQAIRARTTVELETFVQGALCVSYSGQCYMSYALGGRSGNRGQCAQPCRRLYTLRDGSGETLVKDRYLLSLKDLNLSNQIEDLLAAGITSFKVEGRLKDQAYVMNVVGHYRRQLDRLLETGQYSAASSGRVTLDFEPDPNKTFNRGFTTYFLNGRGAPITSPDTPKSTGEKIGKIRQMVKGAVMLDHGASIAAAMLHPGDGICFLNKERELTGSRVQKVDGEKIYLEKNEGLAPGVELFRNYDHQFHRQLEREPTDGAAQRKIGVSFRLEETPTGAQLWLVDEDGNEAEARLDLIKEPARNAEKARASIEQQLRKLGGTEFTCQMVLVNIPQLFFIPLAAMNELRRKGLGRLMEVREHNRPRRQGEIVRNAEPYPEKDLSYTGNVLNQKAESFYHRHGVNRIEPAAESGLDMHGRKVMTTRLCLRFEQGACLKQRGSRQLVEPLTLADDQNNQFLLKFNCRECVMEIFLK